MQHDFFFWCKSNQEKLENTKNITTLHMHNIIHFPLMHSPIIHHHHHHHRSNSSMTAPVTTWQCRCWQLPQRTWLGGPMYPIKKSTHTHTHTPDNQNWIMRGPISTRFVFVFCFLQMLHRKDANATQIYYANAIDRNWRTHKMEPHYTRTP